MRLSFFKKSLVAALACVLVITLMFTLVMAGGFQGDKIITHSSTGQVVLVDVPQSAVVGLTDTQTLTNKTLTSPELTSPTSSGAIFTTPSTTGSVLCLKAGGVLGYCSVVTAASGTCTCN